MRRKRVDYEAYLYLLPTFIGMALFSVGAVVASFFISFTNWEITITPKWIGLSNYIRLAAYPLFWKILLNTVYYVGGSVPLGMVLSLGLALLANRKLKGITFFRSLYFLPVVSSMVAIALVWSWLYNPQFGLINYFLEKLFRIPGPRWLQSTTWAMPAMIFMGVWRGLGYQMVIFLAGLQNIPEELYEAAKIDGANFWQRFLRITLPMVSPTTFFVLIISIIGSFQIFEQTYIMTQGGPSYSTLTLSYYIFQNAFEWFHMGYAAALAYVLFGMILAITLIQARLQKRWVFYR
jgi:multiple sugar transport system permease protein